MIRMITDKNINGNSSFDGIPIPNVSMKELTAEYLRTIPDYDDNFTIEMIIQKILKDDRQYDLSKILSAYEFAAKAHEGQKRSSGQDYIIHPLAVSYILLELGMDTDTICSALLHDVVEDTPATLDDLKKRFGQDVALLVDGVTKLGKIPTNSKEQQQAENVRKILLAMSQDIRVMIIKLGDRLHNMRTLKYRPHDKQISTAIETMNIYAPIAHRLGIRAIQEELEDLSFRYLDPFAYNEIENILENKKEERQAFIEIIKERIQERFQKEDFSEPPVVSGRVKSIYSIYKKIFMMHKHIDEIYDKYAVRVIVCTIPECYSVLGLVHDMFKPLPNRFKDYIATPKANDYRSLHTTVLGTEGIPFEVQIRTWDMHETAEYGIAAHWKYKEGIRSDKMEQRLAWVRQVIEAQQTSDDVEEIVRIIKTDIAPEDIVVMTPKGKSVILPMGSNVIDFAYRIHTEIGHKTIGAKVDGRIVPLDFKLETGQICEIITTKDAEKGPNRAWLNTVFTNAARSKIRSWFKKERREENIAEGKAAVDKLFKRHRINVPEKEMEEFLRDDFAKHNCETIEDFYASVGYYGISIEQMLPRLKERYNRMYGEPVQEPANPPMIKPKPDSRNSIILDQINDIAIKFAQCCNPLPGDDIVGFITRGFGLSVHTTKCTNYRAAIQRNDPEEVQRWFDIQWSETTSSQFQTSFEVTADDRVGLMYDITAVLMESRIPIVHSASRVLKNGNALFECTIVISSMEQLKALFDKLGKIKNVISVKRSSI